MIRKLAKSIREYKKQTILTPLFVTFEVILEVLIPLLMSRIIDEGLAKGNMEIVYLIGLSYMHLLLKLSGGKLLLIQLCISCS